MYRENPGNQNHNLAKECRIALEKNFGGAIPMPEYVLKKESQKRAKGASLKKKIKIAFKVAINSN